MLTRMSESAGDLVCLKAAGKLTDEDYKAMMPQLEAVIAEHGSLRLLAVSYTHLTLPTKA